MEEDTRPRHLTITLVQEDEHFSITAHERDDLAYSELDCVKLLVAGVAGFLTNTERAEEVMKDPAKLDLMLEDFMDAVKSGFYAAMMEKKRTVQ